MSYVLYDCWLIYDIEKQKVMVAGKALLKDGTVLSPPNYLQTSWISRFWNDGHDLFGTMVSGEDIRIIGPYRRLRASSQVMSHIRGGIDPLTATRIGKTSTPVEAHNLAAEFRSESNS